MSVNNSLLQASWVAFAVVIATAPRFRDALEEKYVFVLVAERCARRVNSAKENVAAYRSKAVDCVRLLRRL